MEQSYMVLFGRGVDMSHTCNGTILVSVIILFGHCVDMSLVTRPLHIPHGYNYLYP